MLSRFMGLWAAPLALLVSAAPTMAAPHFDVTDLGTLPKGQTSAAHGLNTFGAVTGKGTDERGLNHALLITKGKVVDLGTPARRYPESSGAAINLHNQVTGFGYAIVGVSLSEHAFLYSAGKTRDLGTLPGGKNSSGKAINNAGDIVGAAEISNGQDHAVLFSHGDVIDLNQAIDAKLGWELTTANDITDTGLITGSGTYQGHQRGYLLSAKSVTDLGSLSTEGDVEGNALNAAGVVTGGAVTASGQQHAFLAFGGTLQDLGTLTGDVNSVGLSINRANQVVGVSVDMDGTSHGFFFSKNTMMDLNRLINPKSGWIIREANCINDNGQISGVGYREGKLRAILLTPHK